MESCGRFALTEDIDMPVAHISFMTPAVELMAWLDKNNLGFLYTINKDLKK